ncbi:hypothetical protein ACHWQZ_G006819 [Mnemiopsis leidyi]
MVEAEVVDTAPETNGYSHSEPIADKLTTVGEEKKVLLRQNHYNNASAGLTNGSTISNNNSNNNVSNENVNNNSRQTPQRNPAIFSNPMKQAQQMPYKRSPSPAQQQWQSNRGNYWSGQQKMPYHSPYMQNNNYNNGGYRNDNNQTEQLSRTNLYIRGLPHHTTDDELANMCKRFGKITSTKAITDKQSNKCKGYGFVDFESPEAAQKACQHLTLQGTQASFAKVSRKMSINDQIRKQQHDPSKVKQHNDNIDVTNLYISNLPRSFTEEQLNSLVMPFGEIVSSRILKDPEGNSKGVGFARLESKELCEKAIKALNGKPVTQGGEPLIVKFAEAPNPNKKRPLVYFAPAWAGAGMEENGQIPAMSFVQPMFSDVSLQQNGASAIPTPGPRPLLIHPSMQMVPLPIQYNNIPNGQWMSPQFVPLTTFPHQLSPVDHHALASQMGQLHLGGAGYIGTPPYTPYSTPQANHTANDPHHPNYTIYDASLQ